MPFSHISSVLGYNLNKNNLTYKVEAALALKYFDAVAQAIWGQKIQHQAKALYLKDHILTIAVLSSVLATELKLRESEIISEVNKKIGREAVRQLRFLAWIGWFFRPKLVSCYQE